MNRNKILRGLVYLLTIASLLPALISCRDDSLFWDDDVERTDNLPVELEVNLPEVLTRSVNPKTEFESGDFIHVQGTFHMDDNTDEIRYGAFRYLDGKWEQYLPEGTTTYRKFTWPNNCVTAEFLAYYLPGNNALLVPTDNPENNPVTNLSTVAGTNGRQDTDPLVARSASTVKYGHTIVLNFIHACAYLTVEDMPPGISTRFWFTQLDETDQVSPDFCNAFRISLTPEYKLNFEFVQDPNPAYNNAVYIEAQSNSVVNDGVEKAYFGVFLPPGQYTNFTVGYPGYDDMNIYMRYIKKMPQTTDPGDGGTTEPGPGEGNGGGLDGDDSDSDIEQEGSTDANPFNILEENGVYRFNLSKSAGISILTPPPGEVWDDSENPIYPVDAEEFLYKVCNPQEYKIVYKGEEVKILEVVGNGTRLCQNVNMQWAKYDVFKPSAINGYTWFEPDLARGNTFDGDHHYIWNLGSPLLHTVNGTVKDLGITNADISFVTRTRYVPDAFEGQGGVSYFELNRRGAICNYVQYGTLNNIRIRAKCPDWYEYDVEPDDLANYYKAVFQINAYVYAEDSQEAHNIGCLVGSNLSGTINKLTITCDMTLNIANYPETTRIPTLSIGGIIGQSVSTLTEVGTENSPTITIYNLCKYSNAAYYVGGIVGYHSGGTVSNVFLPNVMLQGRQSEGFNSYMGGAAGGLSNAEGGQLINCTVSGSVYAGKSSMNTLGISGSSFTGGLAGECYESYTVNGCRSVMNVYGPTGDIVEDSGVIYGTGGMFGRILQLNNPSGPPQTPDHISDIIASGAYLVGPAEYIGNFAGMVPSGETWEDNYQGRAIIVTVHDNVPKYIGNN